MSGVLDKLRVAEAVFNPGANAAQRVQGAQGLGVFIPDNAIIVGGYIDVEETLTSNGGNDAATIALSVEGADDLVAAIAISAGTNVWDAGLRGVLPGSPVISGAAQTAIEIAAAKAASYLKTTGAKEIVVTVAVEDLDTNAGKFRIFIEYYVGE